MTTKIGKFEYPSSHEFAKAILEVPDKPIGLAVKQADKAGFAPAGVRSYDLNGQEVLIVFPLQGTWKDGYGAS